MTLDVPRPEALEAGSNAETGLLQPLDALRPELHSSAFHALIDVGSETLGNEPVDQLLHRLGVRREQLADKNAWFSLQFGEALLAGLVELVGDPSFFENVATIMLSPRYLGVLYPLFKAFGTPSFTYAQAASLTSRVNKVGVIAIRERKHRYACLVYRAVEGRQRESSPYNCRFRQAQFACATTLFGLPRAEVEHTECMLLGAEACVYHVRWQERPARFRSVAGVVLGAAGGVALTWLPLIEHPALWLMAGLGALAGWGVGRSRELVRVIADRDRDITEHQQALTRSAQNAEQRYEELLEAKSEVDKKVDQRTAELQHTSQRLTETLAELQALDRSKTDFFNNVSHELRSPLTLILGPLEDLIAGREPIGGTNSALSTMQRNATRLLHLINQLLDLAKIDAGKMSITRVHTDLAELARAITNNFQIAAAKRRVSLSCEAPDLIPPVPVDPSWIESALTNLIANAMRFVREGGHVTVRVIDRGASLDLQVADDGVGIAEVNLEKIFQRFSQADVASSGSGGTGIGLALVREAGRMHGGDVRVESKLGKGSVFTLSLPRTFEPSVPIEGARNTLAPARRAQNITIAQLEAEVTDPRSLAPTPSQSGPVAVVAEDSQDLRTYIADVLSAHYRVHTAVDGVEALELVKRVKPDVVVSDIGMPRLDGYGLCRALRSDPETRSIAVLLVTARDDLGSALEGFDAGANDYLSKPFHGRELLARVDVHVRLRRMVQEFALRERHAALGVMAASVAHQVRNPLTTLISGLPAMQQRLKDKVDARTADLMSVMIDCATRIERISLDLMDLSRVDREEGGDYKPSEGLLSAVRMLQARAPKVIVEEKVDEAPVLHGRVGDMNHVFLNLLDNAIRAAGDTGRVRVEGWSDGEAYFVRVGDSGPGIDPEMAARIFEPFFTTRQAGEGTGLGLAIAHQVVQHAGGDIHLERSEFGGAAFVVRIPIPRKRSLNPRQLVQ